MTPKEYKQMMDYLTRSGVRKQIKFASDIARPDPKPRVKEIKLFNEFNKRNPKADGGRIGFKRGTNLDRAAYKEIRPITQANIDNYTYFTSKEAAKPYKFKVQLPSGTEVFKTKKDAQAAIDAAPITNRDYTEGLIKSKLSEGAVEFDAGRIKTPTGEFVGEGRDKAEIFKIQNKDGSNVKYTAAGAGGGKKKLYNSIEEVKKAKLEFLPDELVKIESKRLKENINEITYKNKKTGKITKFYKPFIGQNNITIPGKGAKTLKEAEKFVKDYFKANPKKVRVRDPEKDYRAKDIRRQFEKDLQGRTIQFGAPKGYTAHHMLPLAGKADVTDSDIAIISNKMNAELAQFDKPMNALVNEAYALDFSKEGSLKRMDEINKELADIVKKAETTLPKKYKGLIGFNKLTPVLGEFDAKGNQVFDIERIGADYKKSISGKKIGTPLRDLKRSNIRQMVFDAPKFKAKIPGLTDLFEMAKSIPDDVKRAKYLKAGFKTLGIAAAPLVIYDTYKAFEQGKPILEALEQGFIGTDLIGGTKRVLSLTPEEREARSVVKQDALKDLNLEMPMGFGFIEGPTPDTDMTLQEAQQKMDAGIQRVKEAEAQKNLLRSQSRGFGTPVMADQFLAGGGIAGLSGGKKSGPPPISGPTPDGDEGLPAAFKNVRKR